MLGKPKPADCRKCRYFQPYINKAGGYLGFCNFWNIQITRYKGYCRAYTPKEIQQQSLKKYIPGL